MIIIITIIVAWCLVPGDSRTEETKREKNKKVPRSGKRNTKIVEDISKCDTDCSKSTMGGQQQV